MLMGKFRNYRDISLIIAIEQLYPGLLVNIMHRVSERLIDCEHRKRMWEGKRRRSRVFAGLM